MLRILIFVLFSTACAAQPPAVIDVAKNISSSDLQKNLYQLASPEMEGRGLGTKGDTMAARMIGSWFSSHGLQAPYASGKSYFQEIRTNRFSSAGRMAMGTTGFPLSQGWLVFPRMNVTLKSSPVLFAPYRSPAAFLSSVSDLPVRGKIILLEGKAFLPLYRDGSIDKAATILKKHGAVAIAFYSVDLDPEFIRTTRYSITRYELEGSQLVPETSVLPQIMLTVERVNDLLKADGLTTAAASSGSESPVTLKTPMELDFSFSNTLVTAPNVIGVLPGSDPSLPVVILSAHHDHDGVKDGQLYPGAVDNASGTVAIMEIASLMQQAAKKGFRPKRTIVFASFTGEENGLLGSYWYAANPVHSIQKTKAVLNIDMLGRVDSFHAGRRADSNYAYILVKDTVGRGLRQQLLKANHSFIGLDLDPFYEDPNRVAGN